MSIEDNIQQIFKLLTQINAGTFDQLVLTSSVDSTKAMTLDAKLSESYQIDLPPQKGAAGQTLLYDGDKKTSWATLPAPTGGGNALVLTGSTDDWTGTSFGDELPVKYNGNALVIPAGAVISMAYATGNLGAGGGFATGITIKTGPGFSTFSSNPLRVTDIGTTFETQFRGFENMLPVVADTPIYAMNDIAGPIDSGIFNLTVYIQKS